MNQASMTSIFCALRTPRGEVSPRVRTGSTVGQDRKRSQELRKYIDSLAIFVFSHFLLNSENIKRPLVPSLEALHLGSFKGKNKWRFALHVNRTSISAIIGSSPYTR